MWITVTMTLINVRCSAKAWHKERTQRSSIKKDLLMASLKAIDKSCKLFYKRPGGKDFKLCRPYSLCCNFSTWPLQHRSSHRIGSSIYRNSLLVAMCCPVPCTVGWVTVS